MKQKEIEELINLLKRINDEDFGPADCKITPYCVLCREVMNKMSVAVYIYDNEKNLICTNNRNDVIINKKCSELQQEGYNAFISYYNPFDNDIIKKREKLITKGEEFTTKVLFRNTKGEFDKYLVTNRVFVWDEYNRPVLFIGESTPLKYLYENDEEIKEIYLKDDVYKHLDFVKQFTERQREVIYYTFYEGLSNPDIADKMNITEETICTHRKDIIKKVKSSCSNHLYKIMRENLLPDIKKEDKEIFIKGEFCSA